MNRVALVLAAVGLLAGCSATGGFGSGPQPDLLAPLTGGVISTVSDGKLVERMSVGGRRDAVAAEFVALQSPVDAEPQKWSDPRTGASGVATAGQPYRVGTQDCRPITQSVSVDGHSLDVTGSACREPDGRWVRVG